MLGRLALPCWSPSTLHTQPQHLACRSVTAHPSAELLAASGPRPRLDPAPEVLSPLYGHQKEALAWMVQRENGNGCVKEQIGCAAAWPAGGPATFRGATQDPLHPPQNPLPCSPLCRPRQAAPFLGAARGRARRTAAVRLPGTEPAQGWMVMLGPAPSQTLLALGSHAAPSPCLTHSILAILPPPPSPQLTNFIANERPAPLRGGILADDMVGAGGVGGWVGYRWELGLCRRSAAALPW